MTPLEFQKAWTQSEQNLQPISLDTLSRFGLDKKTVAFFWESGLPDNAAPALSFVSDVHISDSYSRISLLTEWFTFLESEYEQFVAIGSDGSGDIIAINKTNNFVVEWLDHEDYFSSRFMNSSVIQLANYLLCYRDFVKAMNEGKTEDELVATGMEFSDQHFNTLQTSLKAIDPKAMEEGFWKEELDFLIAYRDDTRNKRLLN